MCASIRCRSTPLPSCTQACACGFLARQLPSAHAWAGPGALFQLKQSARAWLCNVWRLPRRGAVWCHQYPDRLPHTTGQGHIWGTACPRTSDNDEVVHGSTRSCGMCSAGWSTGICVPTAASLIGIWSHTRSALDPCTWRSGAETVEYADGGRSAAASLAVRVVLGLASGARAEGPRTWEAASAEREHRRESAVASERRKSLGTGAVGGGSTAQGRSGCSL